MMHVVSGKLRKPPFIKDGCGAEGSSRMYGIELSEMIKDYRSGEKTYTNYKAIFFAKTDSAKQFYDHAFAEGAFVVVASEKIKVDQFLAESGVNYITLNLDNAKLESCMPIESNSAPARQKPPQQNQSPQQQKPQYNEPPMDFDDDIPFGYIGIQNRKLLNSI